MDNHERRNNVNLLNAGAQDVFLRLEMLGGGFDLNWVEFSSVAAKATRAIQSGSWDDAATWHNGVPHLLSRVRSTDQVRSLKPDALLYRRLEQHI